MLSNLDRAEDMQVVGYARQRHLSQLIGHHHGDAVKEGLQVVQWDLFPLVSQEEDVLQRR